ncbi:MAG: MFS transporter, partial [Selenomonadaceae bacterium]|nr:MFS transporter [Selenomonadaceae bacterium]
MDERRENIRYCVLLGVHTMMLCPAINFVTPYLAAAQVSTQTIGILVAVSCLLAVAFQQFAGRLVDRNLVDGRKLLLLLTLILTVGAFSLLFIKGSGLKAIIFGGMYCLTFTMLPILNSFSFFYENKGISVNYGIARGCGSMSFAVCSMVLGFLMAKLGTAVIPLGYGLLGAALFAILLSMPTLKGSTSTATPTQSKSLELSKFPAFRLMLIGLCLVMLFHNMVMTYFIYAIEYVGGDSSHLGMALGIAAFLEIPILFLYTRIKGNTPSKYFLTASGVFFFAKAALFVVAQSVTMIYLVQILQIVSYGLMVAARVYYVDEIVGKKYETTGQAYIVATETVGIVLGS